MAQKAQYTKGFLQEIPDMEEPRWENFCWMNEPVSKFEKERSIYEEELAVCRLLPAPDFKGIEGQIYEEGKDYKLQYQCLWSYGQGSAWADVDEDDYKSEPFKSRRIIAVPIASESQDDLWGEIIDILLSNGYDRDRASNSECVMAEREIKSKFVIQRRK